MIGQRLSNRYDIRAELGHGGMGVVYRAHDPLLNREVAIKLIPPTLLSPETEQRFQREAQLVAQMDHPAVVPIFDFGKHNGSLFFVMPVVEGTNLRWFQREGALTLGEVIDIGIQVAEALEYSHSRGVFHRDIKPENIMVVRDDRTRLRVRIMDFGLARGASESRITKTGTIAGTLSYMSPEQVAATGVDHRSDVYSLGTVLYECLTGEPPFSGELQSILYRIVHEIPQPPRLLGADINEELEEVILTCIAKDPAKRPQHASEVAEALRRCQTRLHQSDLGKSVVMTKTLILPRVVLSPFIGREKEQAELQKRLNAAISGECQFVVVSGEPGVGKTRLLDEIENLAKARKLLVLHGRSIEQDGAFPYQGFCEAIQEYFRQNDTFSSPDNKIELSDVAPDLVSLFPMLTEISEIRGAAMGDSKLAQTSGAPGGSQGPENRTQIFELLARTLTRLAAGKPLILFLEDLHAAEISIEALQYIVRRLGPTPTLIVGTYRTSEVDSRSHPLLRMLDSFRGDRRFSAIALEPFSPPEHRLFLETLIGGPKIADSLVEKLYEGTEGNPFFTKELVRSLLDSGGISKDQTGAWSLGAATDLSTADLPATIQQAVERRIERLPEELRDVLSIASVIGKAFDSRDLEALAGAKDVEDAIDRLVDEGLLEEERESRGDRLTFSSGVVRDVLYGAISRRKRRSLHRKYAEEVEKRHAGRLERVYPQLVHHFSQGDVPDKTVAYGLRMAKAALDAFSPEESARATKTVLEFLDEEWEGDPALEGDARLLLAQAHRMAGDVDAALKEAESAARILERESHESRAVTALLLAAETAWQARKVEEATRLVQQVMDAARAVGDKESLRHVLSLAATLANLRGEYEKANNYLEEAAALAPAPKEIETDEEVPKGGKLVVAMATPLGDIDPVNMELVEEQEILANVFETLLATDLEGNLIPALCEKWEVSDKGTSVFFNVRENIRFQNDEPLTALSIKRSFERSIKVARELPPGLAAIRGAAEFAKSEDEELAGILVNSDYKLEIQLPEPLSIYPALLTDYKTGVTLMDKEGDLLIGTGPFRMASYTPDRIVLQRNERYWKGSSALLDEVEFRAGLSASEIASGLRFGSIDLARDLSPQDLEESLRDPRFRGGLVESPRKNTYFLIFNSTTGSVGQNADLRRALSEIVRVHDLVWQTLGRFAQPAVCLIPPGLLGYDPGRRRQTLTRDEAMALLAQTGLKEPITLRAAAHPLFLDRYKSLLTSLLSLWSDLGVKVEVATPTMASYLESFQNSTGIDLFIGRWNADYDDPDDFTYGLFHSRVGLYRSYISSAAGDQILEEARTESRPGVRALLYRKYEGFLQESGMVLPLFHDVDYRLANSKVLGLNLRGSAPYVNYAEIGKLESGTNGTDTLRAGGGTINVAITGTLQHLDPSLASTVEDAEVLPSIFETLTRDVGGARIVPWLASDFKAERGGKRYRFRLRDDVRFHDGRKLTARDVRYSFERLLLNPDSNGRFFYSSIHGAKALLNGEQSDLAGFRIHSADEFTIELDEPVSFFPALISYHAAAIVPEGTDNFSGSWQEGAVGTGPFRVVKFEPSLRLELERNKTYWRSGFPKVEKLIFNFGVSPADILAQFRAGQLSLASDLLPADAEALRREPEFASGYREIPNLITYYAVFNTHRGPLKDKRLRQKLVESVNVASVLRQTLGRLAVPAHGLIPPGLLGHDSSYNSTMPVASPPLPQRQGEEIELTAVLNPVFFSEYAALAREISRSLREHQITIRAVNKTMEEWMEAVSQGSVDVVLGRWAADYPDADTFANILATKEGLLGHLCGSAEVDRLIARGRSETSPAARHAVYRQIEEIIARDRLLLPLFHEQTYRFARPEVEGLSLSYGGIAVDYSSLRIQL